MPKAVFFSELQEGKRDRRASRKRYKDHPKRQVAQARISHQLWQQEDSDRDSCGSSVRKASCKFEAERHEAAKERRRWQKERSANLRLSKVQKGLRIKNRTLQPPTSMQEMVVEILVREERAIIHEPSYMGYCL